MQPTKVEKKYWDRLINEVGCIACRTYRGNINHYCLIHHIEGRTKKRKDGISPHMKVIPLCSEHHDRHQKEGIHFMSRRKWELIYGKQEDLQKACNKILEGK